MGSGSLAAMSVFESIFKEGLSEIRAALAAARGCDVAWRGEGNNVVHAAVEASAANSESKRTTEAFSEISKTQSILNDDRVQMPSAMPENQQEQASTACILSSDRQVLDELEKSSHTVKAANNIAQGYEALSAILLPLKTWSNGSPSSLRSYRLQKLSLDSKKKTHDAPEVTKKASADGGEVPSIQNPSSERSVTPLLQDCMDQSMWYPSTAYYYGGPLAYVLYFLLMTQWKCSNCPQVLDTNIKSCIRGVVLTSPAIQVQPSIPPSRIVADVKHDVTLPEALLSNSEDVEWERRQASRDIVELDAMEGIMGDNDDRPDRPREKEVQPARDNLDLDERLGEAVRDIVNQDNTSDDSSDSGKDDEEIVADVSFINHNSDIDNKREEARDKIRRFVQLSRMLMKVMILMQIPLVRLMQINLL
ncbi:hypothetical protein J5N97_001407 [Dioscorea zingiberensis]|uniref:Uncharacterized protein n=1 Tax=Dioscorea zingiberensis TaxID=325984 RepID=A0A9D5BU32_9LILI|nr:hypothetical protein J5N97_001407 [Dioscorea zingiberensis]